MEAMTQEFMLHRRPHVEIWSAREGSDDDTSEIHIRNQTLMDLKQSQPWTRGPLQKPKSDGSPNQTKPKPNHKPWDQIGPIQKPKSDGLTSKYPNVASGPFQKRNLMHQTHDINQTQVFFPGSDYTSYKAIGGKSHILTARILCRQKSRRRIGKP